MSGLPLSNSAPNLFLRFVGIRDFATTREALSEPLLGSREERDVVIAANANVMFYGVGGGGKTTLNLDLVAHLGAGIPWHGIAVERPIRQLYIESEGDRAEFRLKIERKLDAWEGPDYSGHVSVLEEPWAAFTLEKTVHVDELADKIRTENIDLVWMGPGAEIGMVGAGSPADVTAFGNRIRDLRDKCMRPIAIGIVHHENKGGDVSGAWDRWSDTLIRVELDSDKTTDVYFHKARHSSKRHRTTMVLAWAENESYTLVATDNTGPRKAPADAIAIWIRNEAGGRATPKQLRDHFDISEDTLRNRRPELAEHGIDYRGTGTKAAYLDRDVYPAIGDDQTQSRPEAAPRDETRGNDFAGLDRDNMRESDPAPPNPAIQHAAGNGNGSEQGKDATPDPALSIERDRPPAGSGLEAEFEVVPA